MKATGLPNFVGARVPVQSDLLVSRWRELLVDYSDYKVCEFLEFGFPLDYSASSLPNAVEYRNHSGARRHARAVSDYLQQECSSGRIAGPFKAAPFANLMVSPINTVPKSGTSERRILVDLSWPFGSSVNDGIVKGHFLGEPFELHFPTVDDVCNLVLACGPGALIYKRDLAKAYRQFPIDPFDYHHLGYYWNDSYYFDTVLCMGQRSAALSCQRATRAAVSIHNSRGFSALVYLDDFLGVEAVSSAQSAYVALGDLLRELGLKEKFSKAVPPSTRVVVLGVLFDTDAMTLSVTKERLTEINELLSLWLDKAKASRVELQRLLGKLSFVSKCVRQSRVFLNRLFEALRKVQRGHHCMELTMEFRMDIIWWITFLRTYNGVSIIPSPVYSAPDHVFSTDACLSGCGALCTDSYFHSVFPNSILEQVLDINCLELLTVVVSIKLWGHQWCGLSIEIFCDNSTTVLAINSGSSRNSFISKCLRELWLLCARFEIMLRAKHLPGIENRLADYLSRWHLRPDYYSQQFFSSLDYELNEVMIDPSNFDFECNW